MEIRNIQRAKELINQYEVLKRAKDILSENTSDVLVRDDSNSDIILPKSVRMNVLHAVNCEYERVRKEIQEL